MGDRPPGAGHEDGWLRFNGGMLYEKPVWQLMAQAASEVPTPCRVADIQDWFRQRYPKVKPGTISAHVVGLTANDRTRRHYAALRRRPPLFFKRANGSLERFDPSAHGVYDEFGELGGDSSANATSAPIAVPALDEDDATEFAAESTMEFVLEAYLEEFLLSNWHLVDWQRPLKLYGGTEGHQFHTEVGRLDFLCEDTSTDAYVVVELKRGRPSDQVVGQVARYMAWVRRNLAGDRPVEGIIVAQEADLKLRYAVEAVPGMSVLEYRIQFSLVPASLDDASQE
jgi:hypothetical protein